MIRETFKLLRGTEGNLRPIYHQPESPEPTINPMEEAMNYSVDDDEPGEGNNSTPNIFWPKAIDQKFLDVAYNARDEFGQHIECMAFLCGYKDVDGIHPTHLIFPRQQGNSSRVEDLGIDGQDSTLYMANIVAPTIEEQGREYKLISWIHTHVRGTPVGFSSIDLHNHHGLHNHVSGGIFGTVYEISENRYMYKMEPYVLTEQGNDRVKECLQTLGLTNHQHSECFDTRFYKSIKAQLIVNDEKITVIDGRKSQPLEAQPSGCFFAPSVEIVESNQCRTCKRKFDDESALCYHVGRTKKCKPTYESEIGDFRSFLKREGLKRRQLTFSTKHPKSGAERQKKYEAALKEEISLSKQQAYKNKKARQEFSDSRPQSSGYPKRVHDFKMATKWGPIFPCMCCNRLHFKKGVRECSKDKLRAHIGEELFDISIHEVYLASNKFYLCHSCHRSLFTLKKRPDNSYHNGLQLDPVPPGLKNLTDLEQQLISKTMLFMKIRPLPRSRMDGITDRVINVPLMDQDISDTLASLPRTPDESYLVTVKLKRMLGLKNVHKQAFVRPFVLEKALDILASLGNPHYQNIQRRVRSEADFLPTIPEEDEQDSDSENDSDSDSDSDVISPTNEMVEDTGHLSAFSTCMVPNNPEAQVIMNNTDATVEKPVDDSTVILAPGENKVPTNFLRDSNYEGKAFPKIFPTGNYDLGHERGQKLSTQKYFNQRTLNVDPRCAIDSSWVFAAQLRTEMERLEKECNIIFQRGKLTRTREGVSVMQVKDDFAVLKQIRGSPKYWKQARNELIARCEALGPFHAFFTLSCAEMRWTEVVTSIIELGGNEICFDKWDKDMRDENILVNGVPLTEFLEGQEMNKGSLLKDNVLLVTRMFDERVKNFVKHMIMKDGEGLLPVDYFTYRVEFQLRGMAHVHGCLWLNEKFLKAYRDPNDSMGFDHSKVGELIDQISTCSLPGEANTELDQIVRKVQVHKHTKSCRKYSGSSCRFHYPHFPSDETIVALPILDGSDENGSKKALKTKAELILSAVKAALEGEIDESMTLGDFLEGLEISMQDYKWALSISTRGPKVVLKRTLAERFVNNYHPQYLLAWNANMDIQFCFDPYAVITYISDYYGKDDSGMGELLTAALRECKGATDEDKLKVLRRVYMTHRQIGACESIYRLISSLLLKNSNVVTKFVQTGFPENRSKQMRKVSDDISGSEGESSGDEGEGILLDQTFKVKGRAGTFQREISIHERYASRPPALEHICLGQFATLYNPGKAKKGHDFQDGCSKRLGEAEIFETKEQLPKQIQLPGILGTMTLRGSPSVLRIHNSKRKKGEGHEYYYAEQLLFLPWRNEIEDLHRHDPAECIKNFKANLDLISRNKKAIFPFSDHAEEFLDRLDTVDLSTDYRPGHFGETLDAQAEQENLDVADEIEGESFSIHHPGTFDNVAEFGDDGGSDKAERYRYKQIDVSNPAELEYLARQLIPEQRAAFDKVHLYCFKVAQRFNNGDTRRVDPVRLIIHGGSGAGKSNVIRAIAKHAEHLLRKAGHHPNKPRVVITAPTGMASSNVSGTTIHSGLGINTGHKLSAISEKKLGEMRCTLEDVKLIIVDEMSMVSADMMYKIHEKLCLLFSSTEPFGGKSIVFVGDLCQLEPVQGRFIFDCPKHEHNYHAYNLLDLWKLFSVVVLRHNHRQGEGNAWANTLNRLRFGIVEADDLKVLKGRLINKKAAMQMDDACHIYYTNKEVNSYNTSRLNQVSGQLYSVEAMTSSPPGHKPRVDESGRIDKTSFIKHLKFKIGARVMLIHNVDLIDDLSNGMMGTVTGVKVNDRGVVTCIIVAFDNPKVGEAQRRAHPDLATEGERPGTPIFRTEFGYQLPSKKGREHSASAKVIQFPLRLSWGVTAHKVQGQTFTTGSKVVIHWNNRLMPGMAYVMLGRNESLRDLYIAGKFKAKQIKCHPAALRESQELDRRASQISGLRDIWFLESKVTKVAFLNIRSLHKHHEDLLRDSVILASDVISLAETWLMDQPTHGLNLPGYALETVSKGFGKGVACYTKDHLSGGPVAAFSADTFQVLRVSIPGVHIITVYRSGSRDLNIPEVALKVQEMIDECGEDSRVMIVGDFNFPATEVNNFTYVMSRIGYKQIVNEPTHLAGRCIDHCYVKDPENAQHFLHSVYYSDHMALCITLR